MYSFQGIWYRIVACGCFFLVIGLWALISSHFWNVECIVKKYFNTGCLVAGFAVIYIVVHLFLLLSPEVLVYSGSYVESRRSPRTAPPFPFSWEYVFDNGSSLKQCFDLDSISSRHIFPDGTLETGETYRIYYEKHTKVIVKVEHLLE